MIETLISLVALAVSGAAYFEARRQTSISVRLSEQEIELVRQQLLERRLAADKGKQANLSARLYNDGRSYKVKVYNKGPADARNVNVPVLAGNKIVQKSAVDEKFPMGKLESGHSVDFWADVTKDTPMTEEICIQWQDADDMQRENRVTISV